MAEACINDLPVLVFAPFGKDGTLIEKVLQRSGSVIRSFADLKQLEAAISEDAGAALITEEVLQHDAISALAQRLAAQPRWSDFPIIVLTGSGRSTARAPNRPYARAPRWEM